MGTRFGSLRNACFAIALLLLAARAQAADRPLAIKGATIFDAAGDAPYVGNVVVRDGRIAEIGADVKLPKGARVIDAKGKALVPGLFDLHTHWTPNSTPSAFPQIAAAYLAMGVTTVDDFNEAPEAYEPLRRWLQQIAAPHVNFAARISTPLGHGADWADENTTRWVNSPEAAREAVDAVAAYKPDVIKAFTDGWRYGLSAENTSMDADTLGALAGEAHKLGYKVLTHTVTVERGRIAAQSGVDVIAHSLQDKPLDAETIAAIKAHGTFYAPTLAVYAPNRPGTPAPMAQDDPRMKLRLEKFGFALRNVKTLSDAGVPIVVGTDAGMFPHFGATAHELELLVRAGLTPTQALVAATATSAAAIGLQQDRGTLQAGKRADLLLLDGKPWQDIADIHKVDEVFIDGKPVYGTGIALPAANAAIAMAPLRIAPLVDDFERPDGRTSLDTLRVDEADGGPERTLQVTEVVDREQGGHALSLQARFSAKPKPFASAILPLGRGSIEPADLRRFHGVRFDVRAGGDAPVTLELRSVGNRRWTSDALAATGQWQTLEIPFGALHAVAARDGHPPAAWTGDDVQQLVFVLSGKPWQKAWLELDNAGFY